MFVVLPGLEPHNFLGCHGLDVSFVMPGSFICPAWTEVLWTDCSNRAGGLLRRWSVTDLWEARLLRSVCLVHGLCLGDLSTKGYSQLF